jgi:hypothetical protein
MIYVENDALTEVEQLARRLVDDMTRECAKMQQARLQKNKAEAEAIERSGDARRRMGAEAPSDLPVITLRVGRNLGAARPPPQEAFPLVERSTEVCWSAHMADKARDIYMFANGRYVAHLDQAMGADFNAYKRAWQDNRWRIRLSDARGKNGWVESDPLHVETRQSKLESLPSPLAGQAFPKKRRALPAFAAPTKLDFADQGQQRYEEQQHQRSVAALKRRGTALGFDINPTSVPA